MTPHARDVGTALSHGHTAMRGTIDLSKKMATISVLTTSLTLGPYP
jgi:hypothetical protein